MQNRQFGKTDLVVTPICFGSWEIGGFPFYTDNDEKSSIKLIRSAFEQGINFFDTAPVYGFGHAEELLGKAIKDFRQDIVISTKCDLRWKEKDLKSIYTDASSSSILEEIDLSLSRLGTDYIDMYMLHWPDKDTATPIGESIETLENLKKAGKIRFYGLSNFNVGQVKEASRYGEISFLQNEYSLINPGPESNQLLYTKKEGLGFQAYSPLARGILTDKTVSELKEQGDAAVDWMLKKHESDKKANKILKLKELANKYSVSLATFVTAVTINRPGVTSAIFGSKKIDHFKEIVAGGNLNIETSDMKLVDEIVKDEV